MNKRVKELVLNAIFIAILAIMGLIPNLGIIQIGVVSATLMHIPVIIITLLRGYRSGFIAGLAFGLIGWFVALQRAVTPIDLLFQNPLISVLPRMLFPLIGYFIYKSLSNVIKKEDINIGISAISMSLLHTILVLSMLYFIDASTAFGVDASQIGNVMKLIISIFSINALAEAVLSFLIAIPAVKILKKNVE